MEIRGAVERLSRTMQDGGSNKAATAAMANLAEGIQSLVQHMRSEQQIVRDWMEVQSEQQQALNDTLGKLAGLGEAPDAQSNLFGGEEAKPARPVSDRRSEG
jgi:hypothetical protein